MKSGGRGSGSKFFRFFQTNFKKLFFSGNFKQKIDAFQASLKKFDFSKQIFEKFLFFEAISQNNFYFPGTNWPFTTTPGQIILFLFRSHHFGTKFLYMIRYNNISRPVHDPQRHLCDPHDPPAPNLGGRDPLSPPGLTPLLVTIKGRTALSQSEPKVWPGRRC